MALLTWCRKRIFSFLQVQRQAAKIQRTQESLGVRKEDRGQMVGRVSRLTGVAAFTLSREWRTN
jgi:hypothetical protein